MQRANIASFGMSWSGGIQPCIVQPNCAAFNPLRCVCRTEHAVKAKNTLLQITQIDIVPGLCGLGQGALCANGQRQSLEKHFALPAITVRDRFTF